MEKEEAYEIITSGTAQSVNNPSQEIEEPDYVVRLFFDGKEYDLSFGGIIYNEEVSHLIVPESELNFIVRDFGEVSENIMVWESKEQFYEDYTVEAEVFTLDDSGEVIMEKYAATPDGWTIIKSASE